MMLKYVILLTLALAGHEAVPLRSVDSDDVVNAWRGRHLPLHRPHAQVIPQGRKTIDVVPLENRRQGTEPSRRFLVDLNTGLVRDYIGEMSRRPSGFYVPPPRNGFRQGTENSHATLVDSRTGLLLEHTSEMMRGYNQAPVPLPLKEDYKHGVDYSHFAKSTKQHKAMVEADSQIGKEEREDVVAVPLVHGGWRRDSADQNYPHHTAERQVLGAIPVENRRQGTEPSRRFLVDLKTGLLKNYQGEMSRKPSGFYVPPPRDGFRQGTENSHATLVDPRTGLLLEHTSEMMRGYNQAPVPLPLKEDYKHGVDYSHFAKSTEQHKAMVEADSQNSKDEFSRSTAYSYFQSKARAMTSAQKMNAASQSTTVPVENRRQGTEPSRRFLVDLKTGLLKNYEGEMSRKPAGFYVPPPRDGFRQGTENSHATLVDSRTGLLLEHTSEMMRGYSQVPVPLPLKDEFKHGVDYSHYHKSIVQQNDIMELPSDIVKDEFSHSAAYSHFQMRNSLVQSPDNTAKWVIETDAIPADVIPVAESCPGEIIDGKCYQFNPTRMTFDQAESFCQSLDINGHIASVTTDNLHKRLHSLVTMASNGHTLTWLGGIKKGQQYEWLDGSAWTYNDWMPGHPDLREGRVSCVEMFRMEATWWTSANCGLKRASICSFPVAA